MNDERKVKLVGDGQIARDVTWLLRGVKYCFVLLMINEPTNADEIQRSNESNDKSQTV